MLFADRLLAADRLVRLALSQHRSLHGPWRGEPTPSVISTALAVVGLTLQQQDRPPPRPHDPLIAAGLNWLAQRQQPDGGWANVGPSDLSITVLCRAAFQATEADGTHAETVKRADAYLQPFGAGRKLATALRPLCPPGALSAPLLGVAAFAGLIPWAAVAAQPFERICLPAGWGKLFRAPVVAGDLPSFVAVGLAVQANRPPWNPLTRWLRHLLRNRALLVLQTLQAADGGFFGGVSVTAGLLAHLAAAGQARHAVARAAARFLSETVRANGGWPEEADDAGLITPLAVDALTAGSETIDRRPAIYSWLAKRQVARRHPVLGEEPGGWAVGEPPCVVPDSWHTAHTLLGLAQTATLVADEQPHPSPRAVVRCNLAELPEAAAIAAQLPRLSDLPFDDRRPVRDGLAWLLAAQNDDGGWPLFPTLKPTHPLHGSSPEVTAQSLRALAAWQGQSDADQLYAQAMTAAGQGDRLPGFPFPDLEAAVAAGLAFLAGVQREDGSWPSPDSAVRTTAVVLLAFHDLAALAAEPARRGLAWLTTVQNADGGWGSAPHTPSRGWETAAGVRVLAEGGSGGGTGVSPVLLSKTGETPVPPVPPEGAYQRGLAWLVQEIEAGRLTEATDCGSPPVILWHRDPLVLIIFAAAALGRARVRAAAPGP